MVTTDPKSPQARRQTAAELAEHAWREFLATCDTYVDLLALTPSVISRDSPTRFTKLLERELKPLDRTDQLAVLDRVLDLIRNQPHSPGSDKSTAAAAEAAVDDATPSEQPKASHPLRLNAIQPFNNLARYFSTNAHAPHRLPLFLRSLLTTHVAALEVLLGHLVSAFYHAYPAALGDSRQITIGELHTFDTVEDIVATAIEDEVDAFMRRSLDDWAQWFAARYKTKFESCYHDEAAFREVMLRRNVVVHNDSRVSRQYRASVGPTAPALGTLLPLDETYARRAFDELMVFGTLVGASAWRRLDQSASDKVSSLFLDLVYHTMLIGRWHAVAGLCAGGLQLVAIDDQDRYILQINGWLAAKRLAGLKAVEEQVRAFDVSALSARFRIARHALLDEHEQVAALAGPAIESKQLPSFALHQWPLLAEFRKQPQYQELIRTHEPWHTDKAPAPTTTKTATAREATAKKATAPTRKTSSPPRARRKPEASADSPQPG